MMRKINRQIPKGIPNDDVNECIQVIEDLLGEKWLGKNNKSLNKMQALWSRKDYLATIELYTLGNAIRGIKARGEVEWLNDFCKQVKSPNESNLAGAVFEAISFSMFSDNHIVDLPSPGTPGYDLTVLFGERRVNVSCKKLQNSDKYKKARTEFEFLKKKFSDILKDNNVTGQQLVFFSEKNVPFPARNKIIKHVRDLIKGRNVESKLKGFDVFLKQISSDVDGFSLSNIELSYLVNLIVKHESSEQKRYEDLFRKASRNMAKHSLPESGKQMNAIMIDLPESVSVESAKEWTENRFVNDGSKISFVMLMRILPAISEDGSVTKTVIQLGVVVNPNSDGKLFDLIDFKSGEQFKLTIPFGSVSYDSPKNLLVTDSGNFNTDGSYAFQSGEITYQQVNKDLVEFNLLPRPNVSYNVLFKRDENGGFLKNVIHVPPRFEFDLI